MTELGPTAAVFAPRLTSGSDDLVANSLSFVRSHLDMEVAYLSEFVGDNLVFRAVDAPGFEDIVHVDGMMSLETTYCRHILRGDLPELIPDTKSFAFAQDIAMTHTVPIRSHVSVPIHRADGTVYGMFCCLSRRARPNLNSRDLEVTRAFASLSADQVNARLNSEITARIKRKAIEDILDNKLFEIALQPIMRLKDHGIGGYEALCRFDPKPYRPPNLWFEDAAEVGLQQALELYVIEVALALLPQLEQPCYIAVNSSPATLASGQISSLVEKVDGSRVVVEITEHAAIDNADALLLEIDRLRDLGARIAIDDAGAGYSGLQQIIRLRPNVIKLDMSLTKDVDKDLARRSLASAMVQFARDTDASVVAEGIETEAELRTLTSLGVDLGQGYHLGRPDLAENWISARRRA